MRVVRSGVTRLVILAGPYAVKVPRWHGGRFWTGPIRGWLANRSEWAQRHRPNVAPPLLTVAHCVTVYRRADEVGWWQPENAPDFVRRVVASAGHLNDEEAKGSSWGRFGARWLLLDYDRAWEHPRGLVGGMYYGRQERMARRWLT